MASQMDIWYGATGDRRSIRNYSAPPDAASLAILENAAKSISARGIRIQIRRSENVFRGLIGSKIKGTDTFAAITSNGASKEMAGYIGEAFVLECASMGLGTCWLGASFSKSGVNEAVMLEAKEKLVCIISIGKPAETPSPRPRRTLGELTELKREEYDALPEWKKCAIECARLAPSAINAQPWCFDASGEGIAVENTSFNFGWGKLDCGIAMLHIELGAAHCGLYGEWSEANGVNVFLPVLPR